MHIAFFPNSQKRSGLYAFKLPCAKHWRKSNITATRQFRLSMNLVNTLGQLLKVIFLENEKYAGTNLYRY